MINKDSYAELGVSSTKKGVHEAIKKLDKGLYPKAFCKIVPMPSHMPKEVIDKYVQIMHPDGVGTKSNIAYLAKIEGIGSNLYKKLAQDAIVMNTDDMACAGVTDEDIYINNIISRNSNRVNDEDLKEIISGYTDFFNLMKKYGINLFDAGGETADVGSYTTTMGIYVSAHTIIERNKVVDCSNIKPNEIIVGLASFGKCIYEKEYNSGIRSNGLTLAINSLLCSYYKKYKEIQDSAISNKNLFKGKYYLTDILPGTKITVGQAILSPTRTYLPLLKRVYENKINITGIIHCSGGGMTKSIKFGDHIRYVKDNLFEIPPIFKAIKASNNIDDRIMYQTFNMGTGMEIIVPTLGAAKKVVELAKGFKIDAKIIGHTESTEKKPNEVVIINKKNNLIYK